VFILLTPAQFHDLTTATSVKRAKEIGVEGSRAVRGVLIRQFMRILITYFLAVIVSLFILVALLPLFNQ